MNGPHMRMLIIDDDVAVLDEMADCYARQGFLVETAVHAGDALIFPAERSEPALAHATRGLGVLGSIPKSMVRLNASGLRKAVEEHIEALEPGLRVVDARFVVGRSAVDLVALDAKVRFADVRCVQLPGWRARGSSRSS